jgi:CDP-diacylglycerol--glycerol-3-phosphate 3-phosphatidyltransferase/cardiolipin synthase
MSATEPRREASPDPSPPPESAARTAAAVSGLAALQEVPTGPVWAVVLPNVLTGFRLGLAATFPLIPAAWRLPVVILAAVSDGVDGWVARRFDGASWIGGLLDAAADKAFVLIVLFTALAEDRLTLTQLALVLPRDITVAAMALVAAATRRWAGFRRVPARRFGKWTTALLFALFVLLVVETQWPVAGQLVGPVLLAAAAASVLAAIDYAVVAVGLWREVPSGKAG